MRNQKDALVAEMVGYWRSPDKKTLLSPLPFISAPTYATDGIVLEWVQRGPKYYTLKFEKKLRVVISSSHDNTGIPEPLWEYLLFYKPGMHAQALLAVEEERDGEQI